ncbi:hypothetical protein KP79_PYT02308 [Mizuhopecten yessoensis]|uniref:Uncharacterized protein n=1 Tax=Mizuhopecten yessoensis TaxID=6573 RepID=A0A210PRS7_MIZYE|nr:hypothetical protein KP79_PYT02308 [Mizuhopecten yessoensis]
MPRKRKKTPSYRMVRDRNRKLTGERRRKRKAILALDKQDESTPNIDEPTESTSNTSPNTGLTPDNNCQTKSTSDGDRIFKYYSDDIHSKNEDSYRPTTLSIDHTVPKLEYTPKKYQTVITNQNQEKKRARGRPTKYNLEWEAGTKSKEYDPNVVQCCLCFRNLLFGCNGQKVFKKHKHFETNNVICSSCQQVSDVNTSSTNTSQSQNTYEKLEHLSEMSPGSIKPVTKVVYVVRPPSEIDKLIIKKPRIYKKRRTLTPALIDDLFDSSYEDVKDCIGEGASSSHTNNTKHASTTTTHIWPKSNSIDNQITSYDDDEDDDCDDDSETKSDDNDERLTRYSSRTLFVKVGKPRSSGNSSVDLQSSTTSRNHQKTLDRRDDKPAVVDGYLRTEVKREPVDPEYEFSLSNSSFEKNLDVEVKIENVDPTQEHFSQTYDGTAVEQPLPGQYVNEDLACINSGIGEKTDNFIPTFGNSEKDPFSSKHFHKTDDSVGSAAEEPPQSQNLHVNKDLAYIYLSNQDGASLNIPKSSQEKERSRSPGDNCVAVIPVLHAQEYIKKEAGTE